MFLEVPGQQVLSSRSHELRGPWTRIHKEELDTRDSKAGGAPDCPVSSRTQFDCLSRFCHVPSPCSMLQQLFGQWERNSKQRSKPAVFTCTKGVGANRSSKMHSKTYQKVPGRGPSTSDGPNSCPSLECSHGFLECALLMKEACSFHLLSFF